MFIPSDKGAGASTISPTLSPSQVPLTKKAPSDDYESVRHLLFGSLRGVQATIRDVHIRGYAEAGSWSQPIPTGRANEVMAILTKRIRA